jgi:hypothetical protein
MTISKDGPSKQQIMHPEPGLVWFDFAEQSMNIGKVSLLSVLRTDLMASPLKSTEGADA